MSDELTVAAPDDAEALAAAEQAEQDSTGEHVVAFGCQQADRVFLAAVPGQRQRSYNLPIPECPGCGQEHVVQAQPRPRRISDEIDVQAEPPKAASSGNDSISGRRQISDQAITDAIPAGTKPLLTDVATALEYSSTTPLLRRLRRMNDSAEKAGRPAPFKLTKLEWRGMTVERVA